MKKINKILSCFLICVTLFSIFVVPCFASAPPEVTPLWDNISDMDLEISFSGTNGTARGTLTKQSDVTSVEGTVTVYRAFANGWIYVDSESKNTIGNLGISVDFTAISGVEYKVVFEATAYRGDVGESHTVTKYATCH